MTKALPYIIAIALGVVIFTAYKGCNQNEVKPTVITQIKWKIDSLKGITYHDTIFKIQTKYRRITDSIPYNVFDTSWRILRKYSSICDSVDGSISDAELQSLVSRKLVGYCECNDLNRVYQSRRQTDSLIIVNQDTLISIVERENRKIVKATAKETRRKRVWKAAAIGLTGLILIK